MQVTNTLSPARQSVWNDTDWVPNTSNTQASAPLPPVTDKPRKENLGLKITGGILAILIAVGIGAAGGGEDTGAEAPTPTSSSYLPPLNDRAYEPYAELTQAARLRVAAWYQDR